MLTNSRRWILKVSFHDIDSKRKLKYVVIQAKYKGQWVFVRHQDRSTWEIVGGHIEVGELPLEAAKRELNEETGATKYKLEAICDYGVDQGVGPTFGRLYYGELFEMENLQFEIEEIIFQDELPENLTYKEIQPILHQRVKEYLSELTL